MQWRSSFRTFLPLTDFATYLLITHVCLSCSLVLSQGIAKLLALHFFFPQTKPFFSQVFVPELTHKASRTGCHVASTFSPSCAEERVLCTWIHACSNLIWEMKISRAWLQHKKPNRLLPKAESMWSGSCPSELVCGKFSRELSLASPSIFFFFFNSSTLLSQFP